MSQFDCNSQGSWKESISDDLPYRPLWWSWKESNVAIYEGSWNECAHQFPKFFPNGLERTQLLPYGQWSWNESICTNFQNSSQMVLKGVFISALAVWGILSWAPWLTLLFYTPWGSLLCPWGSPWAAGGHWACLSADCLALVLLGLDLFSCAGLAHGESFSPSTADFFSVMKLKACFSVMLHFAVPWPNHQRSWKESICCLLPLWSWKKLI